jgi:hypothetical protein
LVRRDDAEARVRHFGCRQQLICMAFAQLTWRAGLRDIATCLNAKPEALYHLGFRESVGKPALAKARNAFPGLLRRVRYFDAERKRALVFLTNCLEIPALTVAQIYRLRWQIELFFRWIKGHLRIQHYFGTSPNVVKTQIWIAVAVYLMVAILHKQLNLPGTLHRS